MSNWQRACAAVVVPLLLAAGCAGGSEAGSEGGAGTAPTGGDRAAASSRDVVAVRLVVSGGITGAHQVYAVRRDGRAESPRVAAVLDLAGELAASDLPTKVLRGPAPCCDVRVYELTIRRADGTRTRIRAPETQARTPELQRLVTLLSATGGATTG